MLTFYLWGVVFNLLMIIATVYFANHYDLSGDEPVKREIPQNQFQEFSNNTIIIAAITVALTSWLFVIYLTAMVIHNVLNKKKVKL